MKKLLLLLALYSFVTIIFTYPLITKLSTSTYGYSGDNLSGTHYLLYNLIYR